MAARGDGACACACACAVAVTVAVAVAADNSPPANRGGHSQQPNDPSQQHPATATGLIAYLDSRDMIRPLHTARVPAGRPPPLSRTPASHPGTNASTMMKAPATAERPIVAQPAAVRPAAATRTALVLLVVLYFAVAAFDRLVGLVSTQLEQRAREQAGSSKPPSFSWDAVSRSCSHGAMQSLPETLVLSRADRLHSLSARHLI